MKLYKTLACHEKIKFTAENIFGNTFKITNIYSKVNKKAKFSYTWLRVEWCFI